MCANKFSIGELIEIHVSSIVNEVIETILIFFYEKIFEHKKSTKTQNF